MGSMLAWVRSYGFCHVIMGEHMSSGLRLADPLFLLEIKQRGNGSLQVIFRDPREL